MKVRGISIFSLILAVTSIAAVRSQDNSHLLKTFNEDVITSNDLGDSIPNEIKELKASFNASISNVINSIITKFLDTKLGGLITEALFDAPNFAARVNLLLGRDVLILNENRLKISFKNLTEVIKLRVLNFLEQRLRIHGLFLKLFGGYANKVIDDYGQELEPEISKVELTVFNNNTLQETSNSTLRIIIRKIILDVVIILMKPVQSRVNETLFKITDELLQLYIPIPPKDYFQSIISCAINQSILKAVDVVETVRAMVNGLFISQDRLAKRSVAESGVKSRSIIGFILGPIRFLVTLLLTPVHKILKRLLNYVFVTLRPVVGGIILRPIESIIMKIISLIPCSNC